MTKKIVFYSRCKPQDSDAVEVALKNNIIFIGYPLWREDTPYDPHNLDSCLVSPATAWDEWEAHRNASRWQSRDYRKNYNFVRDVGPGSIALIPRPSRGIVYAGYVESEFTTINNPPWYEQYMALRADQNQTPDVDNCRHAGDIGQFWKVDQFRPIPMPDIPAWIRGSLFGRSTYARIEEKLSGLDPYTSLSDIMDREAAQVKLEWTTDDHDVFVRLARSMAPSNFEHLVVSLLQLENPGERWFQVGGSGDGGADGLGYTEDGQLSGILQCKLMYHDETAFLSALDPSVRRECKQYLATLHHSPTLKTSGDVVLIDSTEVIRLVKKHWERLPEAMAMRIGKG